jgi:hypothetical protein
MVVVFPRPVRSDQPEDLAVVDLERHVVDRDGRSIRLSKSGDLDDGARRSRGHLRKLSAHHTRQTA